MNAPPGMQADLVAVLVVLALPLVLALLSRRRREGLGEGRGEGRGEKTGAAEAFLTNAGGNGFTATLAGAVAGNVGIGSFIAIVLFAAESPIVAASVAGAYALGLGLCAVLAPTIRRRAAETGTLGLVDLIAASHGHVARLGIWLPVAVVFVLRSAVQIAALAFIVSEVSGVPSSVVMVGCTAVLGAYLLLGGYRAAVETDIVQSLVLVGGVALAASGLARIPASPASLTELGPHTMVFLVAIWLFLPWSAVLAVDNWQRIVVARDTRVAVTAYVVAACACAGLYAVMVLAGIGTPPGADMRAIFAGLMPDGLAWVASAMFVACIMSSIDTFVMPLTTSLGVEGGLGRLRAAIAGLLVAATVCALAFGDVLGNVIAAFNSLVVFLPVVLGALFLPAPPHRGAWMSMNAGLVTTILLTGVARDLAAMAGFLAATLTYLACWRAARHGG